MIDTFVETIQNLWSQSAFCNITLEQGIMLLISFFPDISLLLPKVWGGYVPALGG